MNGRVLRMILLCMLLLSTVYSVAAQTVTVDNGWNGHIISSIGADGSDYYAQSFIPNMSVITRFGVVIQEIYPEGEIILAIAAEDGSGKPNYSAPLYRGTLINPAPASACIMKKASIFLLRLARNTGYCSMGTTLRELQATQVSDIRIRNPSPAKG